MTRKGKIPRLPHEVREQLNRRSQDGEEAKGMAEWLNSLPEVQAVLAAEFGGQAISKRNLSNWKLGGYRDWDAQGEALEAVRRLGSDAAELKEAASGQSTDQLALCLCARLAVALHRPPTMEGGPAEQLERLRALCSDLVALRRGDQNAELLRIKREKLDLELQKYKDQTAAQKKEREDALKPAKSRQITKEAIAEIQEKLNPL